MPLLNMLKSIPNAASYIESLRKELSTTNDLLALLDLSPDEVSACPASTDLITCAELRNVIENLMTISSTSLELSRALAYGAHPNLSLLREPMEKALRLVEPSLKTLRDLEPKYKAMDDARNEWLREVEEYGPIPSIEERRAVGYTRSTGWIKSGPVHPATSSSSSSSKQPAKCKKTSTVTCQSTPVSQPYPTPQSSKRAIASTSRMPRQAPPGFKLSSRFKDPMTAPTIWLRKDGELEFEWQKDLLSPKKK